MNLFDYSASASNKKHAPLAYRMRPRNLDEVIGQGKVVGKGSPLRLAIERDELHSLVLYGPPGTGETSIAQIISAMTHSNFVQMQAVTAGVGDIRKAAAEAGDRLKYYQQRTILFVDEIHRFNKSQQDVLLPFVEEGTLILVGATTENPLYEINNALLSRVKLYILEALEAEDIKTIVEQAVADPERGLGQLDITFSPESLDLLTAASKGDARMALNILETLVNSFQENGALQVDAELIRKVIGQPILKYDRSGDYHYDTISAFIKSIRGSDPDAAVFWLAVMLEGGEDPRFIARRLIIHAAEDIGMADPRALLMASAAAQAVDYVGLPEARIPLTEATVYLATAPKSNSSVVAIDKAISAVRQLNKITVPAHLADSSHSQASALLGRGQGYKYPHSYGGYVGQTYLPAEVSGIKLYHPGENGYEIKIRQFLQQLPLAKNQPPQK
ncbi:MAG: replication-associated recombination protein A [Syntrophomonadaceae bacterium]|nr:replication-associated recombination protein A [Syntrophomonadaceae bacterium]